jgi:hypothetical protein
MADNQPPIIELTHLIEKLSWELGVTPTECVLKESTSGFNDSYMCPGFGDEDTQSLF